MSRNTGWELGELGSRNAYKLNSCVISEILFFFSTIFGSELVRMPFSQRGGGEGGAGEAGQFGVNTSDSGLRHLLDYAAIKRPLISPRHLPSPSGLSAPIHSATPPNNLGALLRQVRNTPVQRMRRSSGLSGRIEGRPYHARDSRSSQSLSPGDPTTTTSPQPAAVTEFTLATPAQARMDSAGNGNALCARPLHAGGEQIDRRKRPADFQGKAGRQACDWLRAGADGVCAVRSTWSHAPPRSTRPQDGWRPWASGRLENSA